MWIPRLWEILALLNWFQPELVLTYFIKKKKDHYCQILISHSLSCLYLACLFSSWGGWCGKSNRTSANNEALLNTADTLYIAQWVRLLPLCKHLLLTSVQKRKWDYVLGGKKGFSRAWHLILAFCYFSWRRKKIQFSAVFLQSLFFTPEDKKKAEWHVLSIVRGVKQLIKCNVVRQKYVLFFQELRNLAAVKQECLL